MTEPNECGKEVEYASAWGTKPCRLDAGHEGECETITSAKKRQLAEEAIAYLKQDLTRAARDLQYVLGRAEKNKLPRETVMELCNEVLKVVPFRLVERLAEPELVPVDMMFKVGGKPFRCDCGCNVFRRFVHNLKKFECNSCGARFTGE